MGYVDVPFKSVCYSFYLDVKECCYFLKRKYCVAKLKISMKIVGSHMEVTIYDFKTSYHKHKLHRNFEVDKNVKQI